MGVFVWLPLCTISVGPDCDMNDLHFQILLPVVEKEKLDGLIVPEVEVGQAREPTGRSWVLKKGANLNQNQQNVPQRREPVC